MEPDDLLCSRNARPPKDGKGSLLVLLLAERARSYRERLTTAMSAAPAEAASAPTTMSSRSAEVLRTHL